MPITLIARYGTLGRKVTERAGIEVWTVYIDDKEAEAVAYPELTGNLLPGDRVLLNTTAVELELGTGGQHFIISSAEIGAPVSPEVISREQGHIIKMRYTPLQCRVLSAEEEASPYHEQLRAADSLPGTPVVCLGLHSQLAPVLGGLKAARPDLRVAYVVTDSGALPIAYSRLVAQLREMGVLDVTVTAGQAFGGDLEAVNLYSALVTAVVAGKADIIIAGQGPGNVGTGTPLGFGGVEQAMLINAVAALGGQPVAVPRISFADPRERHHGVSHHTRTVLSRLALAPAIVPLPLLPPEQLDLVQSQLRRDGIARHTLRAAHGEPGIRYCQARGIDLRSMGRRYDADPAYFLAAAAAGRIAAEMLNAKE